MSSRGEIEPSQPPEAWQKSLRPSPLRYFAPLLSAAILSLLVSRASRCGEPEVHQPPWLETEPNTVRPAKKDFLKSTKSFGIDGPAVEEPAVLRSFVGGTKSSPYGFGSGSSRSNVEPIPEPIE